jgi:hypothetical protein
MATVHINVHSEFARSVLTSCVENGFSRGWFTFHDIERDKASLLVTSCGVTHDEDTEANRLESYAESRARAKKIGEAEIIAAAERIMNEPAISLHSSYRANVAADLIEGGGNLDEVGADAVLQVAVLGDVIYG